MTTDAANDQPLWSPPDGSSCVVLSINGETYPLRTYRYASTMGNRYCMPLYFDALDAAQEHQRNCDRLLGGLPGQDSMRVEEWRDGEWKAVTP